MNYLGNFDGNHLTAYDGRPKGRRLSGSTLLNLRWHSRYYSGIIEINGCVILRRLNMIDTNELMSMAESLPIDIKAQLID
jgi:hypothetical protein